MEPRRPVGAAPDPASLQPADVPILVNNAWVNHLTRTEGGSWGNQVRHHCWASTRRTCVRAMALDLLNPGDRGEANPDSLERMKRGKERENSIIARLHQIGPWSAPTFEVVEQQSRFEVKDKDGTLLITGKLDGRLNFGQGLRPPFEVKSGVSFQNATCLEDLDTGPWTAHAVDQLLVYLLAFEEPVGFFIIDRPRLPLFLPVYLMDHLERTEQFLKDARAAVDVSYGAALPDFTKDSSLCRRCDHLGKSCVPPELSYGTMKVVTDEELIQLALIREKTEEAHEEWKDADETLKNRLRGIEQGILGPFELRGKWGKSTSYEFPDDLKEKYKKIDPKGKFTLKIERVIPNAEESN